MFASGFVKALKGKLMLKPIFKNFAKDMIYLWSFFQDSLHWVGTFNKQPNY
jgi:hypothetical protein